MEKGRLLGLSYTVENTSVLSLFLLDSGCSKWVKLLSRMEPMDHLNVIVSEIIRERSMNSSSSDDWIPKVLCPTQKLVRHLHSTEVARVSR